MENVWRLFDDSVFGLSFKYPLVTPQGHSVTLSEYKVKFEALGSSELYFEVTRHLKVSARAFYEREKVSVEKRYGALISGLSEAILKGHPAFEYSISWQDTVQKTRHVFLVPKEERLYRIIYNPALPLNKTVLNSLELN